MSENSGSITRRDFTKGVAVALVVYQSSPR